MRKAQILSGEELVAKGATKNEALLPEAGVKDVLPNGSWLEQKQIQAAVEARKHLIEVERIEKCGVLSHADWLEGVCRARVTQQAGSYWQHLGHHSNKQLFLYPEEALYLMEVNCLQLKYNEVTVSLQQAYSLLLRDKIHLFQYKVYSSLSRTGYKVFRHQIPHRTPAEETRDKCTEATNDEREVKIEDEEMSVNYVLVAKGNEPRDDNLQNMDTTESKRDGCQGKDNGEMEVESKRDRPGIDNDEKEVEPEIIKSKLVAEDNDESTNINLKESDAKQLSPSHGNDVQKKDESNDESTVEAMVVNCDEEQPNENTAETSGANSDESRTNKDIPSCNNEQIDIAKPSTSNEENEKQKPLSTKETIIQKLIKRKTKSLSRRKLEKHFENIPDCQKTVVTVQVPDEAYLPRNVFLNNTAYVINMDDVKRSGPRRTQAGTRTYSASDEPSSSLVRRIRRSSSSGSTPHTGTSASHTGASAPHTGAFPSWNMPQFMSNRFPQQPWFRPHFPNAMFNFIFQRHFAPQMNFPRFQFQNRPQAFRFQLRPGGNTQHGNREHRKRRIEQEQKEHFQTIKSLAYRLKNLMTLRSPNFGPQNTQALQRLINTYNDTYKTSIKLDHNLDIVEQANIVETIDLEDDGPSQKKPRETDNDAYEDKLKRVKQLAKRLKDLTEQGKAFARHRRAFSNMVMNFNKSFNADVYLGMNFEIIDRRHIVLDSSSEDDCVIDENPEKSKTVGKKLRNPFSVMNHFCLVNPSPRSSSSLETNQTSNDMSRNFKGWIPKEDFGKPANISKEAGDLELILASKADYLYDFVRQYNTTFESWAEMKMSFWDSFEDSLPLQEGISPENDVSNCLVTAEDCTDMGTVLQKLRIIETCTTINEDSSLSVDFDVYNRDVQNFRKSNRPVPHFRILCMKDSDKLPSGGDLETLYSQYKDQVPIILAIVGVGSISYLQIRTTDIPVFIPTNQGV